MFERLIPGLVRWSGAGILATILLSAAEYRGQVKFNGLPIPGATVTATRDGKSIAAITDTNGAYRFPDLADGIWNIQVEMLGFVTIHQDVTVAQQTPAGEWNLAMRTLTDMRAVVVEAPPPVAAPATTAPSVAATNETKPEKKKKYNRKNAPVTPTNTSTAFQHADVNAVKQNAAPAQAETAPANDSTGGQNPDDLSQRAADGFLINGTANNGASSPFAMAGAFGNNRRGTRSMYDGNIGVILDNSVLDARPFSITGQDPPRPGYNHMQGVFAFGGPVKLPWVYLRNAPVFFVNYQWTRNRNASIQPGLMPTQAERDGDFSHTLDQQGRPVQIFDPLTGAPLAGNKIPASQISPQAQALLRFYPLPNFAGAAAYNFQTHIGGDMHQDSLQTRMNKSIGRADQVSGLFALQSTRSDTPNIFGFLDTSDSLGMNLNLNWRHRFSPRFFTNVGYHFSRFAARLTPFFENRENVSGDAGITGNNQEPVNWGPPALNFASGITGLSDGLPSFTRNQTSGVSLDVLWARAGHNIKFGGDFRRQQVNLLAQQDPRGDFSFTGAAAGSDFAGFLFGVPDTSSIAFGNADKYFRASIYEAYVDDDWRLNPSFTIDAGIRWEYWSPLTENYGRLVNLDIAPGFSAVAPVVAADPKGPITGQNYPGSLIHPDKRAIQPRIAISWRPLAASSMVVRAGYGVYYNTSVYLPLVTQMAQQSPLSKSLIVPNSPSDPLTLADGFNGSGSVTSNTFAVDPNFRLGYLQTWQASVQRDLPGALVMTVAYVGSKGTRGIEEFLPNTYPTGATNPCMSCPSGFVYVASNGNSTREAGQIQLRRRLHSGLTAGATYTFSKSIDDAALGGRNQGTTFIAQNWLDLSAERGLSNFDQRHLLSSYVQYTSGMGIAGGTLVNGWRGALLKEWTIGTQITVGSGLPLTPLYFATVAGTGQTCCIRPDYTGASLYDAPPGYHLNPAAYAIPPAGQWGNAGRNTITGPAQFSLDASLSRTFTMSDRLSLDLRVDATNALNHVTYPNWNTTITSAQFGLPLLANAMRDVQTTLRLRF